ncbi:hypothetical protein P7K49_039630 [Saguinus oedipus]|uniref:Uncharacterized protein n=1 Tax=Saguinus oedipus TaxID=9490 RepID=A0ABQ9TBX8_SAGOE|nr:hypothetical protein P7K49_039630 [Saguinus oedipus]
MCLLACLPQSWRIRKDSFSIVEFSEGHCSFRLQYDKPQEHSTSPALRVAQSGSQEGCAQRHEAMNILESWRHQAVPEIAVPREQAHTPRLCLSPLQKRATSPFIHHPGRRQVDHFPE